MPDSASQALAIRARVAVSRPANWIALVRFSLVGAVGYAINLATFATCVHLLGVDYRVGATAAFLVAVANNFVLNRHWTFNAADGHAGFQAARFFVVSLIAFGFNLVVLWALVELSHVAKVPAQAIAIACATPLNFLGNKLWSFKT